MESKEGPTLCVCSISCADELCLGSVKCIAHREPLVSAVKWKRICVCPGEQIENGCWGSLTPLFALLLACCALGTFTKE